MGLEGIVAKKADSPYRGGRGGQWLKIRAEKSGDFVVVGWTRPKIGRPGFGALHLAQYRSPCRRGGRRRRGPAYVGRVGSGFSEATLNRIHALLEPLRRAAAAVLPARRRPARSTSGSSPSWSPRCATPR